MIEMLVVLAILSALFALGAGAFILSGRRLKAEAAADQLDLVIRQARNSALGGGTPAFVEFDTNARPVRLIPWAYRLVGMWHFEESGTRISGGFKNISFVHGCETVDGKIGKGLALASRGGKGFVECSADPDFDCEDGGYLEAYVFLEVAAPERGYVFNKRGCYALAIEADGLLAGRVGETALKESSFIIPLHRWTKVALAWDRRSMRLLVDDAVMAVGAGVKTPIKDEALMIGDSEYPVLGRVDEAKVLAAVRGKPFDLPEGATLRHNAAPWSAIFFAPDGSLDLRYHPGPITVTLTHNQKKRSVFVSMLGLTQRGEVESAAAPPPVEVATPVKPPPPPRRKAGKALLPEMRKPVLINQPLPPEEKQEELPPVGEGPPPPVGEAPKVVTPPPLAPPPPPKEQGTPEKEQGTRNKEQGGEPNSAAPPPATEPLPKADAGQSDFRFAIFDLRLNGGASPTGLRSAVPLNRQSPIANRQLEEGGAA